MLGKSGKNGKAALKKEERKEWSNKMNPREDTNTQRRDANSMYLSSCSLHAG